MPSRRPVVADARCRAADASPPTAATPPDRPPFLVRDVDLGRVVAMRAAEPLVSAATNCRGC